MKAICISESAAGATLVEKELPRPRAAAGEVTIRVRAAGVTPTELGWYPTSHDRNGGARTGAVPSHEYSGEIAETGAGVTGLAEGDEVFGMNDWFADGALAEYCVTRPEWIAAKPRRFSYDEAATVPIGALTAWQGLFERAKVEPGERVLIHGGAGAVGVFAVQLAHQRGARVTATVSGGNVEFVKGIGAEHAIDYRTARFEDEGRVFDVVFDAVGGETLRRSWAVLKPNGRMVTIASDGSASEDERVKRAFFIVEAKRQQLEEVARLLDGGELRTFVDVVAPFAKAAEAYTGALPRTGRGKVVVAVG